MLVTIQAQTFPDWRRGGTAAKLRLYARRNFTTSDNQLRVGGAYPDTNWYREINCTIENGVLSVPAIQIDTTDDSNAPDVDYELVLLNYRSEQVGFLLNSFRLPVALGLNPTWANIVTANSGSPSPAVPMYVPLNDALKMIGSYVDDDEDEVIPVTAANVGANGVGVFKEKVGNEFRFRKLRAGSNVSIAEDGDEIVVGATAGNSGNTTINISGGNMVAASDPAFGGSLVTLLAAIGNANVTVLLDTALDVPSPQIVPATLKFKVINGGKFVKSGTGAINFDGRGIVNANLDEVVFENFAPADVRWTGRKHPSPVATSIFDDDGTGDLNVLLTKASDSLTGLRATIFIYENGSILSSDGVFKSQSVVRSKQKAKFQDGFFTTNAPQNEAPIVLENFTTLTATGINSVFLRENQYISGDPNVPTNHRFTLIAAAHIATAPFDFGASNSNIEVSNFSIVGFDGHAHHSNGSASAIQLGNVTDARIHDLHFDGIHAYAVYCGASGESDNHAESVMIERITCENMISQHIGCVNGRNITVRNCKFRKTGNPLAVSCAIIDFEPNEWDTLLENITIEGCEFDLRESSQSHYAIVVQRSGAKWLRNVYIRNNQILSYDRGGVGTNLLVVGIQLQGVQDGVVEHNYIQGGGRAISVIDSIGVKLKDNQSKFCGAQDGVVWLLQGVANCSVKDNDHERVGAGLQGANLKEIYGSPLTVNVNGDKVQFVPPNYFFDWNIGLPVEIDGVMVELVATPNNPAENYQATINTNLGVRNGVVWQPKFGGTTYERNGFEKIITPSDSTSKILSTKFSPAGDPLPSAYGGGNITYTA